MLGTEIGSAFSIGKKIYMDMNGKDSKSDKTKPLNGLESPRKGVLTEERDEDDESQSLLKKGGGLSKKSGKPRRKVQWNDSNGDKLAEVLEFQPSDVSDSDDEDSDSCICRIM